MNTVENVKIYIELLEEGTDTWRPTQAQPLGGGRYKVLPTPKYSPESETWQFLPGSIVRCEMRATDDGDEVLLAVEAMNAEIKS